MDPTRYLLAYLLTVLLAVSEALPLALAALVGAVLMAVFGIADGVITYHEALGFIDLDLIILLIGVMIVVEVVDRAGTFRYLSFKVVSSTIERPRRLFVTMSLLSAITSLFLSDEAAILLTTAIIGSLSKLGGFDPLPFAIASAVMVNLGGTGTLIGSVVNMAVGLRAGFNFVEFASYILPCEFMLYAVTIAFLYAKYRAHLRPAARAEFEVEVDKREVLKGGLHLTLLLASLISAGLVDLPASGVALAVALIALATSGLETAEVFRRLDWDTIFFAGAFTVIIEVLKEVDAFRGFAELTMQVAGGSLVIATLFLLLVSTTIGLFVPNVVTALSFIPIIEALPFAWKEPLWTSLVLGSNLSGVGLPISSFVIVMTLGALRREGYDVNPWSITKVGIPITAVWFGFSAIYLLLRFGLL